MPSDGPISGGGERPASELRQDDLSGRWVLFAPDRAKRPSDFPKSTVAGPDLSRETCPFCPGREGETPPEVAALRKKESHPDTPGWTVRVIPNKFPALIRPSVSAPVAAGDGPSRPGFGRHEVVIDGNDHDLDWADYPEGQIRDVLAVLRDRLRIIERDPSVRYIQVFKNKGREAGASLRHPHTQILALPVIPNRIRDEIAAQERLGKSSGSCYACRLIAAEEQGLRRVYSNSEFVALAPFASRFPYEVHIRPRRHASLFRQITDEELPSLAGMMKAIFGRLRSMAGDPAYHLVLIQGPPPPSSAGFSDPASPFVHWRFEILPILGAVAGFEWGTECFINSVVPESAAAAYRG